MQGKDLKFMSPLISLIYAQFKLIHRNCGLLHMTWQQHSLKSEGAKSSRVKQLICKDKKFTVCVILPGLSFAGAPRVWASSHSDIASQRGDGVSCVAAAVVLLTPPSCHDNLQTNIR